MLQHFPIRSAAVGLALIASTAVATATAAAAMPAQVAAHATHYVVDGRAYADLDALEAAVRARHPATLRISACEAASARAWMAVVHRFNDMNIHLDFADTASGACAPVAVALPVGGRVESLPTGIDDAAVRRYWSAIVP